MSGGAPTSHSGAVSRRTGEGRCDQGSRRRQLINLAYRLLGSLAEAEDAVQETYARWYALSRQQQDAIESPGAWLMTVASRICLDVARGAPGLTILERTVNGQPGLVATIWDVLRPCLRSLGDGVTRVSW